jgi:hypothetical protein
MGGFIDAVCSFVEWIGDTICSVVNWFYQVLDEVSNIVKIFMFGIEDTVKRADNPRTFGECAAIRKERKELDKQSKEREKSLTKSDRDKLDDLLPMN